MVTNNMRAARAAVNNVRSGAESGPHKTVIAAFHCAQVSAGGA